LETTQPTPVEWHAALLKVLSNPNGVLLSRITYGSLYSDVVARLPAGTRPDPRAIHAGIWILVRQGLAYLDFVGDASGGYRFDAYLRLTAAGEAAANEENESPDNPDIFFDRLQRKVPDASDLVLQYAREAITAYRNMCDLATAVMTGVASEAAFLEMARAFDKWLGSSPDSAGQRFRKVLNDPRTQIKPIFDAFRVAFETNNNTIPHRLKDGIETDFLAVFTLLRIYRNDAGHPTAAVIDREDVSNHLRMLPRYLQRLYALKGFFEQ